MKLKTLAAISFLFTISVFSFTEPAHARCTPGVTRCLSASSALNAAASFEEAERLRVTISKLGVESVLKACTPGRDTDVTEIIGRMCGEGTDKRRLCNFSTTLNCTLEGKEFEMKVAGACGGGPHDCGTFAACARDKIFDTKTASFRAESAPVPKGAPSKASEVQQ